MLMFLTLSAWACDPPSRRSCYDYLAPSETTSSGKLTVEVSEAQLGLSGSKSAKYELPFAALEAVFHSCMAAADNRRDPHLCQQWEAARAYFIERYLGMKPGPNVVPASFRNCMPKSYAFLQDSNGNSFPPPEAKSDAVGSVPPGPYRLVIDGIVVRQVSIEPGNTYAVSPDGTWTPMVGIFSVACNRW